jgi:hypothetical protein
MLDIIAAIIGMAAIAINLVAFTNALTDKPAQRNLLAAFAGAWVGLASALGAAGLFSVSGGPPVPLIGVLFATPLLVVGILALRSQRARAALLAIPQALLIGLNSLRLLGILFLLLAVAGRMSGPFPFAAGLGDMITAALAVPLALRVARGGRLPSQAVSRWNRFGILDLVVAVALGITSISGSPLQLIHAGAGSSPMQYLPYCLIPTVLVPFYLITHAIVAAQLMAVRPAAAVAHA